MGRRAGFTLSEVLITLGIIGVVATLTIPPLVSNYQKKQYAIAIKKDYAQINQVLSQMANDAGTPGDLTEVLDGSGTPNASQYIGTKLSKYFKLAEDCPASDAADTSKCSADYSDCMAGVNWGDMEAAMATMNACMSANTACNAEAQSKVTRKFGCWANNQSSNIDGSDRNIGSDSDQFYRFVTLSGMSILVYNDFSGCRWPDTGMGLYCGQIAIDTNGPNRPPNAMGRDIFNFAIRSGTPNSTEPAIFGLYPTCCTKKFGDMGTYYWKDVNSIDQGLSCGYSTPEDPGFGYSLKQGGACPARLMEENWEMNY